MKNKAADLPPILPNIQDILKEYLICPDRLPIHEYERNQEYWPREPDIPTLFDFDRVPCGTTLKVQRDPNTGKIIEFREVPVTQIVDRFADFRDGPLSFPVSFGDLSNPVAEIQDHAFDFTELLSAPPGFERGLQFAKDGFTVITEPEILEEHEEIALTADETDNTVNLMTLVNQEQDLLGLWSENKSAITTTVKHSEQPTLDIDESEVLPTEQPEIPVLNITKTRTINKGTGWAVMVDIQQPVNDFQERIPKMAIEYEFELDTFQKQAIIKLEEHCDVFVAAHTSAGKTVVAEYAIALSQKHKTRTIYTSPIKALSNQKYRDFKNKFEDVGLVTGDIQINQTGVCLIMTTEILRSMLYRASDIIADLEYVIFDEVHYINDAERGYVWEEVLILLPDHVRIVLLSATVPNAMEFANWLGVTKQRKVYVISTSKRPVPLEHYLYTGIGGKTKDERFLLVNEDEKLLRHGYAAAQKAHAASHGTSGKFMAQKERQTLERRSIMGLIDHLQRNELLPVVAFTFSRAKCDRIADELWNLSLTTLDEKRRIESFFRTCVQQLKEPDRQLPQVLKMQAVLVNGIGVHHSGILPIIKEIVEILFSNGLVKVLFATETFAMGVNMPARTVVFNSIKKFDGKEMRYLKPGEYIQMAGRAGRRGKDKNGTVIIRCAGDTLPDLMILKEITQGKPQKLESQFRLTYSLILNALRLESWVWTVESVMLHSFHEVNHVTKADALKVQLERTEAELAEEMSREYGEHLHQLVGFYKAAAEYIEEWNIVQPKLMVQPRVLKEMTPGRVLVISHHDHYNKLAILLNTRRDYKVLVLANQQNQPVSDEICITVKEAPVEQKKQPQEKPATWYRMVSYTHEDIFQPEGAIGHEVLDITAVDVTRITDKSIKLDCELVLKDWSKRQIPRFRDDPPGQTCQQAIQQLAQLTNSALGDSNIQYLTFPVQDITLSLEVDYMNAKKKDLLAHIDCTKIANFEEQFYTVFRREQLEETLKRLKFLMSSRSLSLYPEYMSRIDVLTQLEHINDQKRVLPKGNVARKMSMNELLITELVLRNTLTHLQPCEIAALLSALVFQVKVKDDKAGLPDLTESLNKGMREIAGINKELRDLELRYQISSINDELNFGLVEFVNEWARGKPFADIMDLTDIQEGIIVRCILQLNETLKDVREAASKFGNSELPTKIDEAVTAIKRDIVFAASLYTQNKEITVSPPNPKFN